MSQRINSCEKNPRVEKSLFSEITDNLDDVFSRAVFWCLATKNLLGFFLLFIWRLCQIVSRWSILHMWADQKKGKHLYHFIHFTSCRYSKYSAGLSLSKFTAHFKVLQSGKSFGLRQGMSTIVFIGSTVIVQLILAINMIFNWIWILQYNLTND